LIRKIANQARAYAWGSSTLIPEYFNLPATGGPMAEVWFGTHAGSLPTVADTQQDLLAFREGKQLPFLLKILAAGEPLSIQAHPNKEQAVAGFERENALGLALDDPKRNYRDNHHKPEMIVALTPFRALTGFRPLVDIIVSFQRIVMQAQNLDLHVLEAAAADWVQVLRQSGIEVLFAGLLNRPENLDDACQQLSVLAKANRGINNVESKNLEIVPMLQEQYPGDPGVVISQLLNLVELDPLQAVELGAGNVHCYLEGLGIEIMASSDNVLRGGLTQKHIDVTELRSIVDFASLEIEPMEAATEVNGLYRYPSEAEDFLLYRIEVGGQNLLADLTLANDSIVLCTAGELAVGDSTGEREVLQKGEAAYLSGAKFYSFSGAGTAFLATS
jgi:mannose-6-phosphate isomerase